MNRRKLLGLLPLSLLGIPKVLKAESAAPKGFDFGDFDFADLSIDVEVEDEDDDEKRSIWVEHICDIHLNSDGSRMAYPKRASLLHFIVNKSGRFSSDEEYTRCLKAAREEHDTDLEFYDAAERCGQKFRHLRGSRAKCPKCGEWSFNTEASVGIPC